MHKKGAPVLRRGDIIKIRRRGGYYHYGIYIGGGEAIHFTDDYSKWNASVRRDKLSKFGDPEKIEVVNFPEGSTLPRETTVLIAIKLLGSTDYHLTRNNCEQLANYCKTGRHESMQLLVGRFAVATFAILIGKPEVGGVVDEYFATGEMPEHLAKLAIPELPGLDLLEGELQRQVDWARELSALEYREGRRVTGADAAIAEAAEGLIACGVPEEWIPDLLGTNLRRVAEARTNQVKKSA